jgi:glycosyltransferase involved in cell wall biosynthesis
VVRANVSGLENGTSDVIEVFRQSMRFFLLASYAHSIWVFRGTLITALQAKGLQVHVAAPDLPVGCKLRLELEAKGLTVHDLPLRRTGTNPLADVWLLAKLWWLLRSVRPDYFMAYTIKPVVYGLLAAWLAAVPRRFALVTGLGYAFQGDGRRGLLRGLVVRLYRLSLGRAHKVFFQNPDDQALFKKSAILPTAVPSVVVNGSGIDLTQFTVVPVPDKGCRFLLIARLLGDKGVREYVQAARWVREKYPQVVCGLVGWIDENPDAITHAELQTWMDENVIQYLGHLQDVRPAIADCTVYVLPSYREGTPRTVLEAMAMGRPIITTDAPGCRETVVNGDNGYLVAVKSVDELAVAMERFVLEPGLAHQMGARSRVLAEDKYDVHKVNNHMLKEMGIE